MLQITRRGVLAAAAAGGGLVVAWALLPRHFDTPLDPAEGEIAFDAWLKIAADGVITVAVPQLEMGQGITSLLPQIVGSELGADWRQMAVEPAPVSGTYANLPLAARWGPLWRPLIPSLADDADDRLLKRWAQDNRFTATADGTAIAAYEMPCRLAAASARAMLAMAAAARWGVAWEECRAENGLILHEDRSARFADLAVEAARFSPPDPPPLLPEPPAEQLRPAQDNRERRVAFPRLDLPSKVDGSHMFAGDVRLPDMVYAAIRHAPLADSTLREFDPAAAAGLPGLIKLVRANRWLAAIATSWWVAEQALAKIAPQFLVSAMLESETINTALDEAVRSGSAQVMVERGEGAPEAEADLALRYDIGPALHAGLETATATARLADDLLELWLPTQAPEQARAAAAAALGLSVERVVLYPVSAGGSFDARLDQQIAIEVALLAHEAGRPVQLMWSRWQEHLAIPPRAPAAGLVSAALGPEGSIMSMRARIASPPSALEFGRRLFANQIPAAAIAQVEGTGDPMMVEGFAAPYAIANLAVSHVPVRLDLPTGRMRGNAHGVTCFMRECFLDEAAQRHQREPLSYRIAMLGQAPRMVACLQQAARLAQWDGGAPGTGQGLAAHAMGAFDGDGDDDGEAAGFIAVIASATRGEGGVRVSRIAAAVDIGRVINRDIALQQIEGGLIFGLGLALGCSTDYAGGLPTHGSLAALSLPTLADCPDVTVSLIASQAAPFDPGEIGVPAVAPAVANALFSATGLRLRSLPLI